MEKSNRRNYNNFLTKQNIIIGSCIFLVLIIILLCYEFLFPRIILKGKSVVELDYNDKYLEKGYKGRFLGEDITNNIKVVGEVNPKKIGTYDIVYEVKKGMLKSKRIRRVIVKDREKPKLDIDSKDIFVCPGSEVVKEKVKAIDNYDGDISKSVKVNVSFNKKKIIYKVSDSSKNTTKVVKNIIYKDVLAPKIHLEEKEVYLFIGDEVKDLEVKATDNCDDNVKVKVKNKVDTNKVGDYVIEYEAIDDAGNVTTENKVVKVREKGSGVIYLTFDDGPNSGTTDVILDILKEEGVVATFFVTNRGEDELIKREYEEGHSIGLHTATHDYAILYASSDAYFEDLEMISKRVKKITKEESKIIRFPGGSSNTVSRRYSPGIMSYLVEEVKRRGYKYYDWNISSGDADRNTPTPDMIYNNVVNNLRKDRVNMVLMHDIKENTRDSLRNIIRYAKENGYYFEKITYDTDMVIQRVNN